MPSGFMCIKKYFHKKNLRFHQSYWGFESPQLTNLSVPSISGEVLDQGYNWMGVNKIADYSKTFWLGKNWRFKHNVLRPGQLTDFGMKVDPEHLVKPEWLHSTFDKPASISISMTLPSTHTVANQLRFSFRPKTNNQTIKEFFNLASKMAKF